MRLVVSKSAQKHYWRVLISDLNKNKNKGKKGTKVRQILAKLIDPFEIQRGAPTFLNQSLKRTIGTSSNIESCGENDSPVTIPV